MVRKLDSFTEPVMDELRACFEDYWGSSTEWHEVNIWNSMLKFFARTSNRMFVGLPLCRNEEFLDGCRRFATDILLASLILSFIPKWIKPVLGYLVIAPNWWHYRKAAKRLLPLIEFRLDKVRQNPEKDPSDILPNDFVTWSIVEAMRSTDPRERTSELIAKRTMTTNFAAIHTTTLTSTNLLIDLLSSDQKLGFMDALTSEVGAIDQTNGGSWSKSALAEMTRTDSALRESMRVSGFVVFGVQRKVVAKEGVTLPDGTNIPYSNIITVPAWSTHHDEAVYEHPFQYDALRFSRQRDALSGEDWRVHVGEEGLVEGEQGYVDPKTPASREADEPARNDKDLAKILEGKNMSSVSTGSHFMQFGTFYCQCIRYTFT